MLTAKKILINKFKLKELGHDFMGYILLPGDIFTFHHIVEAKDNGPASPENGAILCGNTAHPYLNLIEKYEQKRFLLINRELARINKSGSINLNDLKIIHELLCGFEDKYSNEEDKYGNLIIKPIYKFRILNKNHKN